MVNPMVTPQGHAEGFPDGQVEKLRAFGQGDWAVVEFALTGTDTGPLPGPGGKAIPATNRPVRFVECIVLKFEGGKITEQRDYLDQLAYWPSSAWRRSRSLDTWRRPPGPFVI